MKISTNKILTSAVILLFLIAGVALVSGNLMTGQVIEISATSIATHSVGGDRDEHGCIGSAGYTWCEAKQKCLRTWEEACDEEQAEKEVDSGDEDPTSRCTDSDSGKNYDVKGYVKYYDKNKGEGFREDYCGCADIDPNTGTIPNSCNVFGVVEFYCTSSGSLAMAGYECDCYEGACGGEPVPDCTPVCKGMGSDDEGWYDSCTGELIKSANCACYAVCRGGVGVGEGTERSEGYYSSCTGELILKANCANKEPIRVRVREREVELTQMPNEGLIMIDSVEDAFTKEKLTVSNEGLGISTDVGVVRVTYRPEEARETAIRDGRMKEVTDIELVEEKGVAVYYVDGKVPGKVLWIFPVTRDGRVRVDADTNEIIR